MKNNNNLYDTTFNLNLQLAHSSIDVKRVKVLSELMISLFPQHQKRNLSTYIRRVVKPQTLIQCRNCLDLLLRQVKIFRVYILHQPLLRNSLGDDSDATLGAPTQEHLCGSLVVRRADGQNGVIVEKFGGGPGFFGPVEFDIRLRAKTT